MTDDTTKSERDAFGRVLHAPALHDCPDCLSETVLERTDEGVWQMTLLHDEGCPFYTARARQIAELRARILAHEEGDR